MPRGPRGEKRPADVIGNAVKVMRIATGEEDEDIDPSGGNVGKGGLSGGPARARALSPERRKEIAQKAARSRWKV
jgi:hypothetical protein